MSSNNSQQSFNALKRKKYSISFKLRAIRIFETIGSINRSSKMIDVTRATLREWIKQKERLENTRYKRFRSNATNLRRAAFPELEAELDAFIIRQRREKNAVFSGTSILAHARSIAFQNKISGFIGKFTLIK